MKNKSQIIDSQRIKIVFFELKKTKNRKKQGRFCRKISNFCQSFVKDFS